MGDDVHFFGTEPSSFPGETGSGLYFEMVFSGFMVKTCDFTSDLPTSIVRAATPFDP